VEAAADADAAAELEKLRETVAKVERHKMEAVA